MASGGDASRQTPGCRSRSNHSCWLMPTLCFSDSRRFGFRLPPAHLCSVCCLPLNHRANETFLSDDSFPGPTQATQPLQPLPSSGSSPGLTTPTQLNGKKSEMSLPPKPAQGKNRDIPRHFPHFPPRAPAAPLRCGAASLTGPCAVGRSFSDFNPLPCPAEIAPANDPPGTLENSATAPSDAGTVAV